MAKSLSDTVMVYLRSCHYHIIIYEDMWTDKPLFRTSVSRFCVECSGSLIPLRRPEGEIARSCIHDRSLTIIYQSQLNAVSLQSWLLVMESIIA